MPKAFDLTEDEAKNLFQGLSLKHLDLSRLPVPSLPAGMLSMASLKTLVLIDTSLTNVPADSKTLGNLDELFMSKNRMLTRLESDSFRGLSKIRTM